jgi:predicted cobalt transporter CbtA
VGRLAVSIHSPGVFFFWLGLTAICVFLLAIEAGMPEELPDIPSAMLQERLWLDMFHDESVEKLWFG